MTADRARDGSGRFVASRTAEDVLDVMDPLEPYTTGELAGVLGWPRRTVYHYLEDLEAADTIRKKKPEPRRAIWILQEDTRDQ